MTLKIGSKLKGNSFQYVIEGVLGQVKKNVKDDKTKTEDIVR